MSGQLERSIGELVTANEKLLEDIERERRIDDMRKEFIASVSHELKTPIAMIQGYAEGLKLNVNEDEENRNFYCDVITDEAARMNRLVTQLLSLARIESGNAIPEIICFDIAEMARRVLRKSRLVLEERGIDASIEGEEHSLVSADYDMIEQVLTNYITNAVDHTSGDNKLRVRIDSGADKVRVSVFNSGDPIPPESIDSIWTSFYKTDKARTREHGGTGLGLSIVKAIQDAHGNAYGAANVRGGVEFWFDVDAAPEAPETDLDMGVPG
jgi:signal transduction histidine kinase